MMKDLSVDVVYRIIKKKVGIDLNISPERLRLGTISLSTTKYITEIGLSVLFPGTLRLLYVTSWMRYDFMV